MTVRTEGEIDPTFPDVCLVRNILDHLTLICDVIVLKCFSFQFLFTYSQLYNNLLLNMSVLQPDKSSCHMPSKTVYFYLFCCQ